MMIARLWQASQTEAPAVTAMEWRRWGWLCTAWPMLVAIMLVGLLAVEIHGPVNWRLLVSLADWAGVFAWLWWALLGGLWLVLQGLAFRRERTGETLELLCLLPQSASDLPEQKRRAHWRVMVWWAWPGLVAALGCLMATVLVRDLRWQLLPVIGRGLWWGVCLWALGQLALDLGLRRPRLWLWVVAVGLLSAWALERSLPIVISTIMTYSPAQGGLISRLGGLLMALGCLLVWLSGPYLLGLRATHRTRRHLARLANQEDRHA
jgi:hypothetical protein